MEEEIYYYDSVKYSTDNLKFTMKMFNQLFSLLLDDIDALAFNDKKDGIPIRLSGEIRHFEIESRVISLWELTQEYSKLLNDEFKKIFRDGEPFAELLSDSLAEIFQRREEKIAQIKKSC